MTTVQSLSFLTVNEIHKLFVFVFATRNVITTAVWSGTWLNRSQGVLLYLGFHSAGSCVTGGSISDKRVMLNSGLYGETPGRGRQEGKGK